VWTYTFYKTASGQSPVTEFIDGQEQLEVRYRLYGALEGLEKVNVHLGQPQTEKVEGWDFWRLKSDIGEMDYSLFYFPYSGRKYVVVHATCNRKGQKIPTRELDTAKQLMTDYIARA